MRTVAVIGGGFTGTAFAIHLARKATRPLRIAIVEPRPRPGFGVAYDAGRAGYRLNVQDSLMVAFLDDIGRYARWLRTTGVLAADPEALGSDGQHYARRASFGDFLHAAFLAHRAANPSGSTLEHLRDRAIDLEERPDGLVVGLRQGPPLAADLAFLAVNHGAPAPLPGLEAVAGHPGLVADPWAEEAFRALPPTAPVLLVGSGLTAADVAVGLAEQGHRGPILALSRHGLLSRPQGSFPGVEELLRRITLPLPRLIERHGEPATARQVLRWVRADVAAATTAGESWHEAFDDLRDAAGYVWTRLPPAERRRFMRHLKAFYDVHRFRLAPQVDAVLRRLRAEGRLTVRAGRIIGAAPAEGGVAVTWRPRGAAGTVRTAAAAVVNCTGRDYGLADSREPLLAALRRRGLIRPDPLGLGLEVDEAYRVLRADGSAGDRLFAAGPLTRARFGEVVAVPQITPHLERLAGQLAAVPAD